MYKNITNKENFHVPTIAQYKKKNFEIHTAVFPRFMSDIVNEFKDFAKIGKLPQFLKSPHEITPVAEWVDM